MYHIAIHAACFIAYPAPHEHLTERYDDRVWRPGRAVDPCIAASIIEGVTRKFHKWVFDGVADFTSRKPQHMSISEQEGLFRRSLGVAPTPDDHFDDSYYQYDD